MTIPSLVVHGHFYQPDRRDPFNHTYPAESSAAPDRDWNSRIARECYRPNAEIGNFGRLSFDLGPTLSRWLALADPTTHQRIVTQGRTRAIAQSFHHTILPLASAREKRIELAWAARDHLLRFGRSAKAVWLPETAIDEATAEAVAAAGFSQLILAPWQAVGGIDSRHPYRLRAGRNTLRIAFYDQQLSGRLSFEPNLSCDADRFLNDEIYPRLGGRLENDRVPLLLIATDGELYGHHQPFRDKFIQRLGDQAPQFGQLSAALDSWPLAALPETHLPDASSWSCHHGVSRWAGVCPCTPDAHWKTPLRAALRAHAERADAVSFDLARSLRVDLDAALLAWADVAGGHRPADSLVAQLTTPKRAKALTELLYAQESRLAMFTSCAWYWADLDRPEPAIALRHAGFAARTLDELTGSDLELRLRDDLAHVVERGLDAATFYRRVVPERR